MPSASDLPQMTGLPFVTDGGIETTLIFEMGFDLPLFAAYPLLESDAGRDAFRQYYGHYLQIAQCNGLGFVLESPTWRCSHGWGAKLGHDAERIRAFNHAAIVLMEELRAGQSGGTPMVISGNIGPAGDGYRPEEMLTAEAARAYHTAQIEAFAETAADMVTAVTITHTGEAAGVVLAAKAAGLPCAIAFTTETDGRLPSGETLAEAIETVDALTGGGPVYYMINCAHPDHFSGALPNGLTAGRIRGIRANASRLSHAELDEAEELDGGDPHELAQDYVRLTGLLPNLHIFGGCCGTDYRHVSCIAKAISGELSAA
ncbi:homocysteine S-methyltransferase family protein [Pseudoruegeria sp. HB172150]|uniref:homocysteine S-methyltransferase family protein n=1 Tax=Pseudoruegeria sp. HB172150 TaxID=2721164 RepID=UPI0015557A37|nr:homocysteine S-methyltransferase family protein [Pseudoruegeria sp. HB172150]